MPGLHFVTNFKSGVDSQKAVATTRKLCHDQRYFSETVISDQSTFLSFTSYPGYPICLIDTDDLLIVLEGHIQGYSEHELETELVRVAKSALGDGNDADLGDWLMKQNGEFILFFMDRVSSKTAILTDVLGRLPLYLHTSPGKIVVSREMQFIPDYCAATDLCKTSVASYLLFGFVPDRGTLLAATRRAPAGCIIRVCGQASAISVSKAVELCFDQKDDLWHRPSVASQLADEFKETTRQLVSYYQDTALSLSGGMDSRTVAAALNAIDHDLRAFTFLDHTGSASEDVKVAREIADALDLDWKVVSLPPASQPDRDWIIRLKGGIILSSTAEDFPFLGTIREELGNDLIYLSGDGGDKVLPCLLPAVRFRSVKKLAQFILERNALFQPNVVSRLTGVSVADMLENLMTLLNAYPEQSLGHKYVHFMIYERAMKWLFEGEDRNRCSFWCSTPFYGLSFFKMAMRVPDSLKLYNRLYREFMSTLSGKVASIRDAGSGAPPASARYGRQELLLHWLRRCPSLLNKLKRIRGRSPGRDTDTELTQLRQGSCFSSPSIAEYLSSSDLREVLENQVDLSRTQTELLYNLTNVIRLYHKT